MSNGNNYKPFKISFFRKDNLRAYAKKYDKIFNMFTTKKKLWEYIFNTAWKSDETIFINKTENEQFYSLKMKTINDKAYSINSHFNLDIYIIFNVDLINTCHYIYDYLNHYTIFGNSENRICCIESSKSCNISILINHNTQLAKSCECVYDYIEHFKNNIYKDIKCADTLYDNTFTTEKSHNSSKKYIHTMKKILIDKKMKISDINYITPDNYKIDLLNKLQLTYTKKTEDLLLITDTGSNIVSKCIYYDNNIMHNKFPFIFHKYALNLVQPDNNIVYKLIHTIDNLDIKPVKIVAHLHCLDIDKFQTFYGPYIQILYKHFPIIIVTYSFGNPSIQHQNVILIKIHNQGMDIGGKIIAVDYLKKIHIKYEYILFLHSKSDPIKRAEYFNPFFNNLSFILESIERNEYDGYFPPLILNGDYYHLILNDQFAGDTKCPSTRHVRNSAMFNEFCGLLELDNNMALFSEGNNFILSHKTANKLYKNEYYSLLNNNNSFDAHWVMVYYNLFHLNIENIYAEYIHRKLYGNNSETKLGYKGLADSQIEHIFERLVFNIIHKNKGNICILPYSNEVAIKTKHLENQINYSYMNNPSDITSSELLLANNINIMENNAVLVIIACHTDTELKIQCLVHNISMFIQMSKKIVICNSSEFKHKNIEKIIYAAFPNKLTIIDFHYVENDCFVCHSKWHTMMKKYYSSLIHYRNFILTNDSYLFIKESNILSQFIDLNYEMQSILISNERSYHYTDFLRIYNYGGILKINEMYKTFINSNKKDSIYQYDIISDLEMKSHTLFKNKNGLFEENNHVNIHFIEPYKKKYIEELNYPIIKIKTMMTTIYDNNTIVPLDFEPFMYISLHNDLYHLTNSAQITAHFKSCGMKEGRVYKRGQIKRAAPYIESYLNKFNITI